MPWNPEIYNRYKDVRYKPFYDLLDLVEDRGKFQCIDLGCGTGEQTATIMHRFKEATILGIDSSVEMLEKSKEYENSRLTFKLENIEEALEKGEKWDLVFSNAAIQWVENHNSLFPKLINSLNPKGQLAIQMPIQNDNILNQILLQLVQKEPYSIQLNHFVRHSPVLSMDEYAQLLFDHNMDDIEIFQKVYPIIADSSDELFEFISGSALIPYVELLKGEELEKFIQEFKKRISEHYAKYPAIYAFKRIFIYAVLKNNSIE